MKTRCFLSFVIMVVVLVGVTVGISGGREVTKRYGDAELKAVDKDYELIQDTVILDEKGKGYVLFCKRKFEIMEHTLIKNEAGLITTFDELEVPCEAKVTYFQKPGEKGTFIAVIIEVLGRPKPVPE